MKIGIGIPTYQRLDGRTPFFLKKALESVRNQTYQDYFVFLIGDHYTDNLEFEYLAKLIPANKIYRFNLPVAVERQKYQMGTRELWCSGGVNAYNFAIDTSLKFGIKYLCHLDHDDYWSPNHLEKIKSAIDLYPNAACIYTCSDYKNQFHLPRVELDNSIKEHFPESRHVSHSSVCLNHELMPLRYRDVYSETGMVLEADIDMWGRLKQYCDQRNLKSYLISSLTCYHPIEGM